MYESIRRLDGLGRIVIPKEMRSKLKINNTSKLKISLENDYIKIEKYSDISHCLEEITKYKNILKKALNLNFIITDLDTIIDNNVNLSSNLKNKIEYGKIYTENNNQDQLFNSDQKINYIIIPLNINGEVIGSIIGYSYSNQISEDTIKILNLVQAFLNKNLEE